MFSQNGSIVSQDGSVINETAVPNAAVRVRPRLLFLEVQRLHAENEQLRNENIELRAQVARLRLYNQIEVTNLDADVQGFFPPTISESLRKFFHLLPYAFTQDEYFQMAFELGYESQTAERILVQYLSQRLLVRKDNELLEKADLCQYELPLI